MSVQLPVRLPASIINPNCAEAAHALHTLQQEELGFEFGFYCWVTTAWVDLTEALKGDISHKNT